MPGMTTMPIVQSAPLANSSARPIDGSIAPANIPDAQDASLVAGNPATVNTAQTSSSDTTSGAEAGSTPDSFADVLKRQMAQTSATDVPPSDFPLLPGLTLPIQPISGATTAISSAPVTVESLLSDLSEFTARRDLGNSSTPVSAGLAEMDENHGLPGATSMSSNDLTGLIDITREDFAKLPADARDSAVVLPSLPVDMSSAVGAQTTDSIPQPTSLMADDDAPEEMPLDALSSLAPLIQSIQPNDVIKPATGATEDAKQPAAANTDGLLLTPLMPTTLAARSNMDSEAAPTATPEVMSETAGKSAEIAAEQDILTAVPAANSSGSEGPEPSGPEKSFDALLATAQALSQHRNTGVHAASASSTALPIHTPVGTRGWDGEVSDKLVWMVGRREQRAELVLNPPQMGRIEVSLSMTDGQTSALFVSANPAVRDALEAALPRLREILADAGVNLGQTHVGADTGNGAGNSSTNSAENRDNSGRGLSTKQLPPSNEILRQLDAPQWLKRGNGLVDIFA